jgi:hypothetical protein
MILGPILDLARRKYCVKDDAEEVDGGRDDEDEVPLDLDDVMGCVIFRDLFRHDGAHHAADGPDAVGDTHQDGSITWCNILKKISSIFTTETLTASFWLI